MQAGYLYVGSDGQEIRIGDYLVRTSDETCSEMTQNATFYQCVDLRNFGFIYVKYLDSFDHSIIGMVSGNVKPSSFRQATPDEIEAYESCRSGIGIEFAENRNGTRFYVGDKFVFDEFIYGDGDFSFYTVTEVLGAREINSMREEDGEICHHTIISLENAFVVQSERQGIHMVEIEPEAEVDFETIFADET